jgi:PAS domain S-box-containing protein
MVGYDRKDLVSGQVRWTDLTPAEWRERDERALAERKSTGNVQPYEKEYFQKDGSRVPVLIGAANFDESGSQGVAFVLDLTERKRAERAATLNAEALRRSEAYLAEAQGLSHTGSVVYNEKTILYWSDEIYRILGFDPGKGLPSPEAVAQRIHPDDRERVHEEARPGEIPRLRRKRLRLVLGNRSGLQIHAIDRKCVWFKRRGPNRHGVLGWRSRPGNGTG